LYMDKQLYHETKRHVSLFTHTNGARRPSPIEVNRRDTSRRRRTRMSTTTREPLRAVETNDGKGFVDVAAAIASNGVVRYGRDKSKRGRARGGGTKTTTRDDDDGTTTTVRAAVVKTAAENANASGASETRKLRSARAEAREAATARGLEIVREATATRGEDETREGVSVSVSGPGAVGRTFVFKSRNKLHRNAKAEREHKARLAKLAESRAFFDDVDGESLAEESEESTPRRHESQLGERVAMSPNGLIEALQGLGLVDNAPELKAKMESKRRESTASLRRVGLPAGYENKFDRVSNWVSSLPVFTPLKENFAMSANGETLRALEEAEKEESIAETEDETESVQEDMEKLIIDDKSSPLATLLRTCDQSEDQVKSMMSLIKSYVKHGVKKIGEGTYGEAYRGEDGVVMKIVPMGGDALVNGEVQMGPNEIRSETAILKCLTTLREGEHDDATKNFTDGFIRLVDASVCRGPYSEKLLQAWDKYAKTGESENERPDNLPNEQLYIAFACDDGGTDLEHFDIRSMKEAVAMLFQIVVALAVAEEATQFEHRDLHWGNVLIKRVRSKEKRARLNGVDLNIQTAGLDVTIIDFTLSRLSTENGDAFCDLNADPELFTGPKGHCQSETYRRMKRVTKGKWNKYNPKTNALWLHYLADTVLEQKDFNITIEEKQRLIGFRKRALDYKSAREAMFDECFTGIWTSGKKN